MLFYQRVQEHSSFCINPQNNFRRHTWFHSASHTSGTTYRCPHDQVSYSYRYNLPFYAGYEGQDDAGSDVNASKNWLAALVEYSDDAIISKNLQGIITSWNKSAERIFGYTEEEIVGKPIHVLIPPAKYEEEDLILSKIRKGEDIQHFETVRITKSGKKINVSVTISPIRNSGNEIVGASKIARDITKQVEAKRKLKKYNKELKELSKLKDDFFGLVSYELKTPLTIIKTHLQILRQNEWKDHVDKNILKTIAYTDKLNHLIDSFLDVSTASKRKLNIEVGRFDVNALVTDCVEGMKLTVSNFAFHKEGHEEPVWIDGDARRIEQVIFNLLNNAVKYSLKVKSVIVKVELDDENVIVSVTDFGIGIAEGELEKIFASFYQIKNSSIRSTGFGLGLYISKQIVDMHGGKLWVVSRPGEGSSFNFSLPLAH